MNPKVLRENVIFSVTQFTFLKVTGTWTTYGAFQIRLLSELWCSTCGLFLDIVEVDRKVCYTLIKGDTQYEVTVMAT